VRESTKSYFDKKRKEKVKGAVYRSLEISEKKQHAITYLLLDNLDGVGHALLIGNTGEAVGERLGHASSNRHAVLEIGTLQVQKQQ